MATVLGLPQATPARLPWEPCQGGTLHRVVQQQDMVIRVPSTVLVTGSHVSAHHAE